jgi:hypothetical protein
MPGLNIGRKIGGKSKIDTALIGAAGVHFVVSELSLRGIVALPTIRNTAAYDIVAASCDGAAHANIQVKSSYKKVSFWPMPQPQKIRVGQCDFYVLVHRVGDRFEAYMLTGGEAKQAVEAECARLARAGKKEFPCVWRNDSNASAWAQRWKDFHLGANRPERAAAAGGK